MASSPATANNSVATPRRGYRRRPASLSSFEDHRTRCVIEDHKWRNSHPKDRALFLKGEAFQEHDILVRKGKPYLRQGLILEAVKYPPQLTVSTLWNWYRIHEVARGRCFQHWDPDRDAVRLALLPVYYPRLKIRRSIRSVKRSGVKDEERVTGLVPRWILFLF